MTNKHYVLAELKCALLRVQQTQADIESIMLALKFNIISPEQAVARMYDGDAIGFTSIPQVTALVEEIRAQDAS